MLPHTELSPSLDIHRSHPLQTWRPKLCPASKALRNIEKQVTPLWRPLLIVARPVLPTNSFKPYSRNVFDVRLPFPSYRPFCRVCAVADPRSYRTNRCVQPEPLQQWRIVRLGPRRRAHVHVHVWIRRDELPNRHHE